MLKKEIRLLGFDDGPFDRRTDKKVLVVGVLCRGGERLDGVLSTQLKIDGEEATLSLAHLVNQCKFKSQIHAIFLDGIAFGGFNVVNIKKLSQLTRIPVITVMRDYPHLEEIKLALQQLGWERRYQLMEQAGPPREMLLPPGNLYFQFSGTEEKTVKELIKLAVTHSLLPESIRLAHLIATGIIDGESRGNA